MTNPDPKDAPASPVAEDPKLDSLEARLAAARKAEDARLASDHAPMRAAGSSLGWQVASTMIGYPLGGIVIGFLFDSIFDTKPWITIGMMFLAFIGGCIHVVRANKKSNG